MKDNMSLQCIDGCTIFQTEVLPCYEESPNSCEAAAQCMLQTGILQ